MKLKNKKTRSGKLFINESCFVNSNGDPIFCKYWEPEKEPKALLFIVHGYGEHCSRYEKLANELTKLDILVFSHDHCSHGENTGYFLDIEDYKQFIKDMLQHVNIMKNKYLNLPIFLFGHSMGGALSVIFTCQNPGLIQAAIFSSPMISKPAKFTKLAVAIGSMFVGIFPRVSVGTLDANQITRDKEQVKRYLDDPLVYTGPVLLRSALELYKITCDVAPYLELVDFPFLVLHGDDDEITDIKGSYSLHEKAKSLDKKMIVFEGSKHEILHEIDEMPEKFINDIKSWLLKRLSNL